MKFNEFNLSESLQAGLRDVKFEEPTPIQQQAIPPLLEGKDLIGVAQTGTGKTGAFVIPIMEKVLQSNRDGVKALILSPTRELASQIDEQIFAIGYHAGISSATVIGGSDFSVQAKALKAGVDMIVATPGRLIDQHKVVSIDFSKLEFLVLDEADRMLDMGFLPDMKKIISWLPENRQTLLFSATMPDEIQRLSSSIMKNPVKVETERSRPAQSVEQRAYTLKSNQKIPLVKGIFRELEWESCIIFTSTKKGTDELQRLLKKEGIKAESIHGDRTQDERNKALAAFKNGQVPVIVATDVLARGIDIKGVSIIVNYDVPNNSDDYIHRIGRTGRYDKSGIAITFVTRRDSRTFQTILDIKGNTIKSVEVPDKFNHHNEFSWKNDFSEAESRSDKPGPDKSVKEKQKDVQKPEKSSAVTNVSEKKKGKKKDQDRRQKTKPVKTNQDQQAAPAQKQQNNQQNLARSEQSQPRHQQKQHKKTPDKPEKKEPQKVEKPNIILPPVIDQAIERNKRARKPAKGLWGLIKSFIPKLKK
ncbi:MAG: DEAD/DEAH box helicase [Balneolaceae bacterium]|nr:MAG: DEAD/DEAH box helicase [Balneolaceae bacterium]